MKHTARRAPMTVVDGFILGSFTVIYGLVVVAYYNCSHQLIWAIFWPAALMWGSMVRWWKRRHANG